jgi:hypothetical protein
VIVVLDSFLLLQLRVDADRVEQLLPQQFGQLLSSVNSVDEDDHLVEGKGVQQMGQLFKLFVLNE